MPKTKHNKSKQTNIQTNKTPFKQVHKLATHHLNKQTNKQTNKQGIKQNTN